jgi:hypothetical protein
MPIPWRKRMGTTDGADVAEIALDPQNSIRAMTLQQIKKTSATKNAKGTKRFIA